MAKLNKAAPRYAKAIFDSLKDDAKIRAVLKELESFSHLVKQNAELERVFGTEMTHQDQRRTIIEDLTAKMGLSDLAKRILLVISEAKRLEALPAIVDKLRLMLLESANVVPVQITAATALNSEEMQKIEQRFNKILGKKVEASYVVDSGLIGGLRVTAGSRTFDGSLAGWLATFEEQLVGGAI